MAWFGENWNYVAALLQWDLSSDVVVSVINLEMIAFVSTISNLETMVSVIITLKLYMTVVSKCDWVFAREKLIECFGHKGVCVCVNQWLYPLRHFGLVRLVITRDQLSEIYFCRLLGTRQTQALPMQPKRAASQRSKVKVPIMYRSIFLIIGRTLTFLIICRTLTFLIIGHTLTFDLWLAAHFSCMGRACFCLVGTQALRVSLT